MTRKKLRGRVRSAAAQDGYACKFMSLSSAEPLLADTLRQQFAGLGAGAHVCPLYETPAQHMGTLVPYFGAGLERGERCLYIAEDASLDDLRAHGIGRAEHPGRDALLVLSARETYLVNGRFDPERMIAVWLEQLAAARAAGFTNLRVSADMSWALDSDVGSDRLIEYEARLNEWLPATGLRAMCHYDSRRFPASILRDVLRTHPLAILGEQLHDNLYFEPPALVLGGAEVDGQRLEWMRARLEARTRREVALADLSQLALVDVSATDLAAAAARLVEAELAVDYVQVYELADVPGELSPGAPLIVPDWSHETRFAPGSVPRPPEVTSTVLVATSLDQGTHVLGVHTRAPRLFSNNDVIFLETVATMLAHALERRRGEDQFRALVENAPDPIIRNNRDFRIEYVNPATERTIGTSAESLIGKTSRDLGILESLVPTWELLLRQVWRTGREQALDLTVHTPTGDRVFDSRIVPEPGADGAVQSLLTIARDVTEQRRAEADRSALVEQLMTQQNRVHDLLSRLARERVRPLERSVATAQLEHLSDRERHILRLLAAGWTNREIGSEIGLTTGTVKNHVARILSKMNAADRTQAAVRAATLGLLDGPEQMTRGA
jgi:PAS domain S-box-containing protein